MSGIVRISSMRWLLITLVLLSALRCYAQTEINDGISMEERKVPSAFQTDYGNDFQKFDILPDGLNTDNQQISPSFSNLPNTDPSYTLSGFLYTPYFVAPGVLYHGTNVAVSGWVDNLKYPGMMDKEVGALGISVGNEKASLYVGGLVNKYGIYGGAFRQLGLTSQFTYNVSDPLSFTAFAYYYFNNTMPLMPNGDMLAPSMLGFYDVSRFGGYLDYKTTENFGMLVGGQVVERVGPQNYYEVEPIVTPYILVGRGKRKIGFGLPVGQIMCRKN